ncbi:MAG: amidohydrolase family protein [Opitutaceae bacterium]|nr:amidohydrolase family protein [Opitutaceae bacterium]
MPASPLPAIDAHGHYGIYPPSSAIERSNPLTCGFMSAPAEEVAARARAAGIAWTVVSPLAGLLPRGTTTDVVAGNAAAFREVPAVPGLLQYVIVNPLQPRTYDQAREMLKAKWCVGIKIHPEEHCYRIADRGEELFRFFAEVGAPVMTHSGCPNSVPADFVPFANRYPTVRLLLAHLGNGGGDNQRPDLQVRAIQAAQHGNLWVDTSSSRSILPRLIEWAVAEIGAERLLFGTDTPLYHAATQRARVESADIPAAAKQLILRDNALKFFGLDPTRASDSFARHG